MNTEPVTQKQTSFLASLIRRVESGKASLPADQQGPVTTALDNLNAALTLCRSESMDRGDASKVIDQAKTLAEMFALVVPDTTVKFRKLDGGSWGLYGPASVLVAGATVIVTKSSGETESKVVGTPGTTPDGKGNVVATIGQAAKVIIPAGVHIVPGTGLYRSEGRHYCDKFVPCHWSYAGTPKGFTLDTTTLVDARTARAVSWLMNNCCFCGRDLSNPPSLVAGYGPTCARQRGLPHGSVEVPDRSVVLAELLWLASLDVGVTAEYAAQRAAAYSDRLDRDATV